ncbi:MAG: LysM peptidoglycan-binding domain-containing protein [Chitinophagaceae bacterium]|nr:MAG: LysM peptidoglycan-binding domain-containing protein [Chitinophagaceae bacterium]
MKKQLLCFLVLSFCCLIASSQELMVKTDAKGLYLEHSVAASQGLYSIGRIYNVAPKSIAAYNNIDFNKGLEIGQILHIPLNDTNFNQKTGKGVPVYYLPATGEGLMKVSNQNKKVTLANLRSWNKLSGDNIRAGEKLVVGYLVSKEYKAPAVTAVVTAPKLENRTADPGSETVASKTEPVNKEVVQTQALPIGSPKQETKPEPVKTEPVKTETVKPDPVKTETVQPDPVKTETVKSIPAETKPETRTEPVSQPSGTEDVKLSSENGFFKTFFDQQVKVSPLSKNNTVTSGIFKTSSGWQDSKYYLLMDGIATGTIVRVINPDNNKAIYAKVLGEMNGIRQNQGLGIRISNAAASALGIREEEKFVVRVNY